MPLSTPISITLYDKKSGEVVKTYSRVFIPWKILKSATKLIKEINSGGLSEELFDEMAGLVAETFGNQFSAEELDNGSDIGEMILVLNMVIARAVGVMGKNALPPEQTPGEAARPTKTG